jgi:hypothetical protein
MTVQVKTCLKSKPAGGGTGRPMLDWWLRPDSPAELVGLVNLADDRVWLFRHAEFVEKAQQQKNPEARLHLYFNVEPDYKPKNDGTHQNDFSDYLIENRISDLFGIKPKLPETEG